MLEVKMNNSFERTLDKIHTYNEFAINEYGRSSEEIKILNLHLKDLTKNEVAKVCNNLATELFNLLDTLKPNTKKVIIAKNKWKLACAEFTRRNAIEMGLEKGQK